MAALAPFEPRPALAVALSGGADSLALTLLLEHWCRQRGGTLLALTVDHGLRPESAAEARDVAGWMAARGVEHRILRVETPDWSTVRGSLQAVARELRYRLLTAECRARGILHLCVAHTRDDQAETLMLRLARGSGAEGLAAMSPIADRRDLRILRPLLGMPRAELKALLQAASQTWVEDPANRDPRHARVRWRDRLPELAAEGLTPGRLAATATRLGRVREVLDAQVARCLAEAVSLSPLGYVWVDPVRLACAPDEVALRTLARVLMTVGTAPHTPRLAQLERVHAAIRGAGGVPARTLAGCRILRIRDAVLVSREWSARERGMDADHGMVLAPGAALLWDRRFLLRRTAAQGGPAGPREAGDHATDAGGAGWAVRPLGAAYGQAARPTALAARLASVPWPVRPTLPALCDLEGVVGVPHLHWWRDPSVAGAVSAVYLPPRPLAGAGPRLLAGSGGICE